MKYYSLNNPQRIASFKEAAIQGIAEDKGLFFPMEIPRLDKAFFDNMQHLSKEEIAYLVISCFVGNDIEEQELRQIVRETLAFDFPVVPIDKDIYTLELFHGPTLAFKDVGAGFMSRCLRSFVKGKKEKVTILVATSGDTGGAVAHGFYDVQGIEVVILYPKGKVSSIQEKQLTTLGKNIKAIEVEGSFDDCQAMVKKAFLDESLKDCHLTSANSINIARWLPQMFYYFLMYKELQHLNKPLVVSVPSGNFGNICAGMLAQQMGLPISHFIAATNANDTIPRFFWSKAYTPKQTIETISNAMDVSDPSNFVRILELFAKDAEELGRDLSAYSFTDKATLALIEEQYAKNGYLLDPHASVGYLGIKEYAKEHQDFTGVFLGTAHPVKFPECIEQLLNIEIPIPDRLKDIMKGEKKSIVIQNYEELKRVLLK
ncbi:threonine synthase [Myroides sp. M-43]|uniref:threonine synthase n=1 Tax=Myroides oncorhynchi TaxID=2893756 RepID=UPI001E3663CB|nr:threonine synthase [Myroides oncorhynchi]MCC9043468.1 threonine synthase [Myroides oncorhynchi]